MEMKVISKGSAHTFFLPKRKRTTKEALQASIDKWTIIAALSGSDVILEDSAMLTCGLCQKFNTATGCDGCPVRKATGMSHCVDSPFDAWLDNSSRSNALKELTFLKSLKV